MILTVIKILNNFNFLPPAFNCHYIVFAIYVVIIFWFNDNILMKISRNFVKKKLCLVFYSFEKFKKKSP